MESALYVGAIQKSCSNSPKTMDSQKSGSIHFKRSLLLKKNKRRRKRKQRMSLRNRGRRKKKRTRRRKIRNMMNPRRRSHAPRAILWLSNRKSNWSSRAASRSSLWLTVWRKKKRPFSTASIIWRSTIRREWSARSKKMCWMAGESSSSRSRRPSPNDCPLL